MRSSRCSTVDGTTQAGSAPNTDPNGFNAMIPVSLDATAQLAYGGDGLVFNSSYGGVLTVTGLELDHFTRALAGNLFVKGNRIQFATYGVYADCASCSGVVVGGPSLADRNYFYGNSTGVHFNNVANTTVDNNQFEQNSYRGLEQLSVTTTTVTNNRFGNNATGIYAHSVTGATVSNNFIGTFDGTTSNGNTGCGIDWNGSQGTIQLNVISGNPTGVLMSGSNNSVVGNYIGTNPSGTSARPNTNGVFLSGTCNTIGGITAGSGNVISGNTQYGILGSTSGALIAGNYIGVNAAGTAALPNARNRSSRLKRSRISHLLDANRSGGELGRSPRLSRIHQPIWCSMLHTATVCSGEGARKS